MSVNNLLVVGSGTAGLITAIILKKKLNITVDVLHSSNIGIVGVGEGSTEHFKEFLLLTGINHYDLIRECDATYKSGIMFDGWGEKNYLHNISTPFELKNGQYRILYGNLISNNKKVTPQSIWQNKIPKNFLNDSNLFPANQFHFNTYKLNSYLQKIAKSLDIKIIDNKIINVNLSGSTGEIDSIICENKEYKYDFYVDATGFSRVLIKKVGAKWKSVGNFLRMNSAITFQTGDEQNYNYWTLAQAMDCGWMFKIPVWGRHGNGYIFDKHYIDLDNAVNELQIKQKEKISVTNTFEFDPGYLEEPWIKNCCAIGLSSNFFEPLEASSIATTIQQSFLLCHKLINYNDYVIKKYNKSFVDIMENIRDFICLHYQIKNPNTNFWKDVINIKLPDTLEESLQIWKNKLPIDEDFSHLSDYIIFNANNFLVVMDGLNLFDKDKIRREYLSINAKIREYSNDVYTNYCTYEKNLEFYSHKEMIEIIRNGNF